MVELRDIGIHFPDLDLISEESEKQISKWGIQTHDMWVWLAFITEELGELSQAISEYMYRKGEKGDIEKEAIQVATLALKLAVMAKAFLTKDSA